MSEVKVRANALLAEAAAGSRGEIANVLRSLGFSGYATDAFSALVRMAEGTAGAIVTKTGIPDSKVYYALEELVEKGLVEVQAGKPKTYRAIPSKEAEARLEWLLEQRYDRERAAVKRLASLLEPLRSSAKSPTTDLAFIVKGMSNVISRAESMIESARKEVVVLASDEPLYRKIENALVRSLRRKVKIRLAVPEIPLAKELEKVAEVRSIVCSCVILVVDRQQVLTVTRTSEDSAYGIISTDETLVALGLEYWESPRCCVAA